MNCGQCGVETPANSTFCPNCGAQLKETSGTQGRRLAVSRMQPSPAPAGNASGEEELWSGSYSPKAMLGHAITLAALTVIGLVVAILANGPGLIIWAIAAVVLWVALGLLLLYRRMTVRYRLTTFRFFHETGLLSRTRNRIEVIDINDVTLKQTVIERMFDVGTIHIQSSDVTDPDIDLPGIENVRHVTDLIDNTRRAERQRRGVFMENIGAQAPGVYGGS